MSDQPANRSSLPNASVRLVELLFGFAGFMMLMFAAILISPSASIMGFVDYPSIVLCVGIVAGFLLVSHGVAATGRGLVVALGGTSRNMADIRLAIDVCDAATQASVLSGVIGSLIGLVIMLGNMSDPSAIGPGMAVSLLTVLYAAVLACMFIAGRFRIVLAGRCLANDGTDSAQQVPAIPPPTWTALIVLPVLLGLHLMAFFVLMLSMSLSET